MKDLHGKMYTSRFTSEAKVIIPKEEDEHLALASLNNLRGILPASINVDNNPDLLYIASNLFVAGMVNKNGDAVSIETGKQMAPLYLHKFLDLEHKRTKIIGAIINYAFTKYGSNEIIESIHDYSQPFNMAYGGILWKILNEQLADVVIASSDPNSELYNAVSSSWEVGFFDYDIVVGSKFVHESEIVRDEKLKKELQKKYLSDGGIGQKDGEYVYRLIKWPLLGIGAGLVRNPAADVKGVAVLFDNPPILNEVEAMDKILQSRLSEIAATTEQTFESISVIANKVSSEIELDAEDLITAVRDIAILIKVGGLSVEDSCKSVIAEWKKTKEKKSNDDNDEDDMGNKKEMEDEDEDDMKKKNAEKKCKDKKANIIELGISTEDYQKIIKATKNIVIEELRKGGNLEKNSQNNSQIKKASVSTNYKGKIMTLTKLYDIILENAGEEAVASAKTLISEIKQGLEEANEEWKEKLATEQKAKEELERLKSDAETALAEVQKEIAELKKEKESLASKLEEAQAVEAQRALEERFTQRMEDIEAEYNLEDQDRKAIVSSVRDLEDEAFANWKENTFAVLASAKLKSNAGEKKEVVATELSDEEKAKIAEEALASAKKEQNPVNPTAGGDKNSLKEKFAAIFTEESVEFSK